MQLPIQELILLDFSVSVCCLSTFWYPRSNQWDADHVAPDALRPSLNLPWRMSVQSDVSLKQT